MSLINFEKSIKKIVKSYPDEKSDLKYAKIWTWLFINPLSIFLTYIFSLFRIQPNYVTLLSLFIGFFAIYFFYIGSFFLGAVFINISYLFDCIDGHLARYYKKTSDSGKFFDDVVGIIIWPFSWVSIGFGLYSNNDNMLDFLLNFLNISGFDNIYFILLGVIAGFTYEFRTLIGYKFFEINNKENIFENSTNKKVVYNKHGIIYIFIKNLLSIGGLMCPILLISALYNFFSLTLFVYSSIFLFVFLFYCFRYYFILKKNNV